MAKEIKFKIKLSVDGKEQLVTATADVGKLKKSMDAAGGSAMSFTKKMFDLNQSVEALKNVQDAVAGLQKVMNSLSASYTGAEQANTLLTTVMKQRIAATDEDIKKVKDVISAQTKLGVVSGTVQKMGAQQIATFVNEKGTLEKLIPAMNDLLVQQKGLNATQEDARGIGNLLGKAMQGQTSALKRVGITFTEAQKSIMECGTEEQKAATLAQIITDNVGHMNAEMAKTDAGAIKKAEMQFGSLKVQIGEIVTKFLPQITFTAQALSIATSVVTLTKSVAGAVTVMRSFTIITKAETVACYAARAAMVSWTAICNVYTAATHGAAIGTTTLKVAIRGLLVATGVGAAIALLTAGIELLINKMSASKPAAEVMAGAVESVGKKFQNQRDQALAPVLAKYQELQQKWALLKTEQQKNEFIEANKSAFEQLGVSIDGVGQAENFFVKNTKAVQDAMYARAEAAAAASLAEEEMRKALEAEGKVKQDRAKDRANYKRQHATGNVAHDTALNSLVDSGVIGVTSERTRRDEAELAKHKANAKGFIDRSAAASTKANAGLSAYQAAPKGGKGSGKTGGSGKAEKAALKGSIDWYTQEIQKLTAQMDATADETTAENLHKEIEALEKELTNKKIRLGIEKPIETKITETHGGETYTDETDYKRKTYKSAQDRASLAQSDLSMGIITPKEAREQIDAINEELAEIDLKPLKIELDTEDFDEDAEKAKEKAEQMQAALSSLGNINLEDYQSVADAIQTITSISDKSTQGLAAAGTACSALGSSMQQLGEDSAAAKAGMVLAALGQLALSFATAMNSAASNWVTWLAFGISGTAQLVSMVATISKFATGGIVPGNQKSGDKVPVMVNSGEMILNQRQQSRLFAIANGDYKAPAFKENTMPEIKFSTNAFGSLSQPQVNINMTPKMRKMMGLMVEYGRVAEKSGKSYSFG